MIAAGELLMYGRVFTSHVTIGGRVQIDGLAQVQLFLDGFRTEIEELFYFLRDFTVFHADMALAIGVDVYANGFSHTDGVGYLHKHLVAHACCHHVLGNPAGGIGSRAVHL